MDYQQRNKLMEESTAFVVEVGENFLRNSSLLLNRPSNTGLAGNLAARLLTSIPNFIFLILSALRVPCTSNDSTGKVKEFEVETVWKIYSCRRSSPFRTCSCRKTTLLAFSPSPATQGMNTNFHVTYVILKLQINPNLLVNTPSICSQIAA